MSRPAKAARASLSAISIAPDVPVVPNDPNAIQMDLTGQILSIIESNPSVSRRELAERLGISERRTRDILKEMQDTGRLKPKDSTRGIWIIVKE